MATTPNSVITAQTPYSVAVSLAAQAACTTRAPTVTASLASANIIALVPTSTNGRRIDKVEIKGAASGITGASAANVVTVWQHDGTTAFPIKEAVVSVVTPSAATASYESGPIPINKVLPAAHSLYVSVGTATTAATTALVIVADGADL